MVRKIRSIQDVVNWGLCIGCGACFYACRKGGVTLVNVASEGIRPRFNTAVCAGCTECLEICPGYQVDAELVTREARKPAPTDDELGPVLEIWEGHAADAELRYNGSSGALLSALALYCLEQEGMEFVLHTGADEAKPWLNHSVQSRSRAELLRHAGSRYAPASPCDSLRLIEESPRPCVFIGKPCDTSAVAMLRRQRPELDRKLGLVLTFFCAGTPSTQGTLDLLDTMRVIPEELSALRYRGQGWPGRFQAVCNHRTEEHAVSLSYEESWGRLTGYRPFRCQLCPDGLGRVADLACGDAWEKFAGADRDLGRSIVLVRTPRGRQILRRALAAGYVILERVDADNVFSAQKNLLEKRHQLFGRLLGMRLLLVPTPRFRGFALFRGWWKLPLGAKLRSILGTLKRLILRGLWRRRSGAYRPESPGAGRRFSTHPHRP